MIVAATSQPYIEASVVSDFLFGHVQLALEATDSASNPPTTCTSVIDDFNKFDERVKYETAAAAAGSSYHAHLLQNMASPAHDTRCVQNHAARGRSLHLVFR